MTARSTLFRRALGANLPTERPAQLHEREWLVLVAHVRAGRTYDDIGRQYGVTRERIRQMCAVAMRKLGYTILVDPPTPPTDPVVRIADGSRRYARRRALEDWWYGRGPFPR